MFAELGKHDDVAALIEQARVHHGMPHENERKDVR
jgi:hypothetical protein